MNYKQQLEKKIKETYPGKTEMMKSANKVVKQLLYPYVPYAEETKENCEHEKERNGRYKIDPNGASRDIPITLKSQPQKVSKLKLEEKKM